ncbi:hypothetical protein GCM10008018_40420 [Paenibacillus marchantiophytorum]|uniref:Uncharacterized protein n=2 Tax=Paenibacillus marchantiophytorum TaxID=1619310 RepID=A0ABQ1EXN7_9BACL|nr:hypothetical protein GCM10008018_40420 [Paenibacillus marchantiophytorum]
MAALEAKEGALTLKNNVTDVKERRGGISGEIRMKNSVMAAPVAKEGALTLKNNVTVREGAPWTEALQKT